MEKKRIVIPTFGLILVFTGCMIVVSNEVYGEGNVPFVKKANPLVGTDAHGHTYPGACLPFGMVQLSPDTGDSGWDWCSGYHYSDHSIMGFSHTHLDGTGCADYGDFLFMPTTGTLQFVPGSKENPDEGYRSRFSHDREQAMPGFYAVHLDDYKINVELTATRRVGVHRYTFPATREANVIIDITHAIGGARILESNVEIINDREVRGFVRKNGWSPNRYLYFTARFSRPFEKSGLRIDGRLDESAKQGEGKNLQCYVRFDTTEQREVLVKVALSGVSCDGAARNMEAECSGFDFEQICDAAKNQWQQQLSKIAVRGGSNMNQRIFYTALYHSCLAPNLFIDVDGQYRGMDKKVHIATDFENYTVFSLWDTFRAAHPLFTLIEQKRTNDFINSMLCKYEQGGLLPYWELASGETWCMIGYHAIPVIADAWVKGIRGYDAQKAFEAMKKSAIQDHQGLDEYKTLGYVSMDKGSQSVSRTVEYAYDDWCIAVMAKELGYDDDYTLFSRRSQNYRNLFDRSIGFVRGKNGNGVWKPDFNPDYLPSDGASEFTEGNSWHYTFFAPHDIDGLIRLMGGDEAFIEKLDELFVRPGREHVDVSGLIGQYAQGNEPCHNYAYLYAYAGAPWKTQEKIAQIVKTLFTDQPDGLCGNNDCGQMSAWYVFSAMGMYPVCPAEPIYVFGTPLFPEVCMNLENGKAFHMVAENLSDTNIYIQSATLNGKPYTKSYIGHADVIDGGKLVFQMGPKPNKQWGFNKKDRPFSIPGRELTLMPYLSNRDQVFMDKTAIDIRCDDDAAKVFYTLDGNEPDMSSARYTKPFTVDQTTTVKAKAYRDGALSSYTVSATVEKKTLKPALSINDDELENGLTYACYEGNFGSTSDVAKSTAQKRGTCRKFDLKVADRRDNFGLEFTGYFKADKDGMYCFWTRSDDGSRLYVDSEPVVNNDGPHGAQSASGLIALAAGYHDIRVLYFEGGVDETLEVDVAAIGEERQPIDSHSLYRKR
jgi:predicted alpha-1,2-mannosidase